MSKPESTPQMETVKVQDLNFEAQDVNESGDTVTVTLGSHDDFIKSCPVPQSQVKAIFSHMKAYKDRVAEVAKEEAEKILTKSPKVQVIQVTTPGYGPNKSDTLKTTVRREKVFPGGKAPNGVEYPEVKRPVISQKVELTAFTSKKHLKDLAMDLKSKLQ